MKVAIVGSRDWSNYGMFKHYMDQFSRHISIDLIISGGARGVDSMAYNYAVERGITFVCHPPKPEDGYPAKFFRRNLRIVEHSECVIAFPKGKSTGTRHSIRLAEKLKKTCYVVEIK
jgi:predicted Rossmann fold nucleotide-binding protein DprA/Smf involved in DNA uptake